MTGIAPKLDLVLMQQVENAFNHWNLNEWGSHLAGDHDLFTALQAQTKAKIVIADAPKCLGAEKVCSLYLHEAPCPISNSPYSLTPHRQRCLFAHNLVAWKRRKQPVKLRCFVGLPIQSEPTNLGSKLFGSSVWRYRSLKMRHPV